MKLKIYGVFWLVLTATFSSCVTWKTQISEIQSKDSGSDLTFKNEDLQIEYDFWSDGGKLDFTIKNITDDPIFIDWTRSNFIINGFAHAYYSEDELVNMTVESVYRNNSVSIQFEPFQTLNYGVGSSTSSYEGVISHDKKTVQIPPKSRVEGKVVGLQFPWLEMEDGVVDFPQDSTFLTVRNYLAYSHFPDSTEITYVDNAFWVSRTEQIKQYVEDVDKTPSSFYREHDADDPTKTYIATGGALGVGIVIVIYLITNN